MILASLLFSSFSLLQCSAVATPTVAPDRPKQLFRHKGDAFEVGSSGYTQKINLIKAESGGGRDIGSGLSSSHVVKKRLFRRKKPKGNANFEVGSAGDTQKFQPHASVVSEARHDVSPTAVHRLEASPGNNGGSLGLNMFTDLKEHDADSDQTEAAKLALLEEDLFEDSYLDGERTLFNASLSRKGGGGGIAWFDRRRRAPVDNRRRRVDCTFRGWSGWSSCNRACGNGQMYRSRGRNSARHGGRSCHGPTSQSANCLIKRCPIHCKWGSWSGWTPSRCPVTCGQGKQVRTRKMTSVAAYGGRKCDDPWLNKLEVTCSATPCPINCGWGAWSKWTTCDASCGVGSQQRSRDRSHVAVHGGTECMEQQYVQARQCNIHPCPIDCQIGEWIDWSPCTKDCGGGKRGRYRPMFVPDQHGGEPCPHLEENKNCNEEQCMDIESSANSLTLVSVGCLVDRKSVV